MALVVSLLDNLAIVRAGGVPGLHGIVAGPTKFVPMNALAPKGIGFPL